MKISGERLHEIADTSGFNAEIVEKVIHLLNLLNLINNDSYLEGRLALKGGTALNLFLFKIPRLSIDIDLNYIGSPEVNIMQAERTQVEKRLIDICKQEGFAVKRAPTEHAGGKFVLGYTTATRATSNLFIDINYLHRVPLWTTSNQDSQKIGSYFATQTRIVSPIDLLAGKLSALFTRTASRDLFDTHQLIQQYDFSDPQVRLGFIVYGAMSAKDWRTVRLTDIGFNAQEAKEKLVPVLRRETLQTMDSLNNLGDKLLEECTNSLSKLFPLAENEIEFITRLRDKGEISAEILTNDEQLVSRIASHPALKWRAKKAK